MFNLSVFEKNYDLTEEIRLLEFQLAKYEIMLDSSIAGSEEFAKTKADIPRTKEN